MVTCLCLFFVACACSVSGSATDELHIVVALTLGERSKDTSSQTTTITVERDAILWKQTFSGRRNAAPSLRKEFQLSPADKENLRKLIGSNNLLVTDSIELSQDGSNYRYFRISVDLILGVKKGVINISGPRTAVEVKEEKLYQKTIIVVKELYRIMNSQDKSVHFEELIHEPKTR